jgi:hypothetical protein
LFFLRLETPQDVVLLAVKEVHKGRFC